MENDNVILFLFFSFSVCGSMYLIKKFVCNPIFNREEYQERENLPICIIIAEEGNIEDNSTIPIAIDLQET